MRDERIRELIDALWAFVEMEWLDEADAAWRETRTVTFLDAIDRGDPPPADYR
ncbi:MAG: hypothetical protein U0232_22500 [Thermomicrobiales bacterium]